MVFELSNLNISKIEIHFQAIVSIKRKSIFGYEALVRAYNEDKYVEPPKLFELARDKNIASELDKYIRYKSIEKFKSYYEENPKLLLFLNFESSSISKCFEESKFSFEVTLKDFNIPFKNIVLEIKEDAVSSTDALREFSRHYKEHGFNIAIDDFGTGSSQFDRLSVVKPNIVKLDKSLIRDLDKNYINAEIVKAISNMCYNIGAMVLCEGVESEAEVLKSLNFHINIYQGYWFCKPSFTQNNNDEIINNIENVGLKHKKYMQSLINLKRKQFEDADLIAEKIINKIDVVDRINKQTISDIANQYSQIEAVYFIDATSSLQIKDTFLFSEQKNFYEASFEGEDHSLKSYYYICKDSQDGAFMSTSYISSASGNICKTFSKMFNIGDKQLIVCLDLYV